ncbi:MAG: NlpC/P60 family protein [Nocardioides sp.]
MPTSKRTLGTAAVLSLGLASTCLIASSALASPHDPVPSKQDVAQAQQAVTSKRGEVEQVQAELAAANVRLQQASDRAEIASEAYNGAQWAADQARAAADKARAAAAAAKATQETQRTAYAAGVVGNYQAAPEVTALAGMAEANGIDQVQQQSQAMETAQKALNAQYGRVQASAALATVTARQASDAEKKAVAAEADAKAKRDAATAAQAQAQAAAGEIAAQKSQLIHQLARLKNVSVRVAAKRQAALEERAQQRAAAAAAAKAAAEAAAQKKARDDAAAAAQRNEKSAAAQGARTGQLQGSGDSYVPAPVSAPPASAGGVAAALAFARSQIGDPYVWGATGPNSWDCSGLTMAAWARGGISLPHYSIAQYEQSTPISYDDLRPGDLVFWGTTDNPSSIHHVALYAGNGMIVQAPHTGAYVEEVSMYTWTAPNFFARP